MGKPITLSHQEWLEQVKELIDRFSRLYYDDPHTWSDTYWMGVQTMKYPTDLIIYAEIIYKTSPDLIIETGTSQGGSALFLAHMCDIIGNGMILSIDNHKASDYGYKKPPHRRIKYIEETDSTDGEKLGSEIAQLARYLSLSNCMVILDSDHNKTHVLRELNFYHPFVTSGCYMIVEDTNLNSVQAQPKHGAGPKEALDEWLPGHPEFIIDPGCNRFILTAHPGGYLRRV